MARVELSDEFYRDAMQSRQVRAGLAKRRDEVAARARSIAGQEKIDPNITTSEGTRPKGRPYARVTADAGQEFGDSNTARRRILGRAADG